MGERRSEYVIRTAHGAFCAACQSLLSMEEEDWGVCDACDGEGIGGDDDDGQQNVPQPEWFGLSARTTPKE